MNLKDLWEVIFKNRPIGPEKVMISPTDYCNLRCGICWRLAKEERYDELSLEEIKILLKECHRLGTKVLDFTGGGEPFLRKDLMEILKLIKAYGFFATLTTNGTLLDEIKIKDLIKFGLDDMAFSLDGPNPKTNDRIRGKGVFQQVVEAVEKLNELKNELNSELPITRLATVITKTNYKELDKMVELAHRLEIVAINFSVLIEWPTNKQFWMREERRIETYLKEALQKAQELKISTNLPAILRWGLFEHEKPNFCFAPWTMSFINASGDVMICCTLASLYRNLVGNVKKESFGKIWFGKKMREFRERVKRGELPSECVRCLPDFTTNYNELWQQLSFNSKSFNLKFRRWMRKLDVS